MTTFAAHYAAAHRKEPLIRFGDKPITRCSCPMKGGIIRHRDGPGFCEVVKERRLALHHFWFDEERQRISTPALRRLSRLARLWAFLRSMLGLKPAEVA